MASEEQLNNAKSLRQELDEILFLQRSFTDEALKSAKAVFGTGENARAASKAFRGVSNATADVNTALRQAIDGEKTIADLNKKIISSKSKTKDILREIKILDSNRIKFTKDDLSINKQKEELLNIIKNSSGELTGDEEYLLELYADQLDTLQSQEDAFNKIKKVEEGMGLFKNFGDGVEEFISKIGGSGLTKALGFQEAKTEVEKFVLATEGTPDQFQIAGKYVNILGKNLLKSLGPLALITTFLSSLLKANEETVKLQKSFLLTSEQAVDLRQDMAAVANNTGNINITATKLLGTMSSINDQFGFVARFSNETLVNTTRLTEQVGISVEAAGALAGLTEMQGADAEDLYETIIGTTLELQKQSGVQIDQRKILEQIGKVTGVVRANLGSNPIQIAKAIQKSKEFGASLEDVAAAGKSLLDFESSIEAELQAELLLGKNINLEKARAAALAGDQVTLAQELQKEAGSFAEFSAMNVIQQEALARAMGMSGDQLADTLYQQELQLKGAEQVRAELSAAGQDEAVRALDAQTAQDKFNKTIEKLQAIVVDVATAFMPILEVVGSIASAIGQVIKVLSPMIGTITGALTGLAVGGPVGALIGGAVGAIGDISTMNDGIIPSGYGETIIKKGKDTIALNNNDSVVAGTNLGGGSDMKETNQLLKMLVTQNNNKPEISPVGLYQVQ
tara:strand:- start:562 stop:2604 length:2043 start_codon:yes stop_codon:yes gene_type:complete